MTATATAWKLPDFDTVYHLEDHEPMTLGQMVRKAVQISLF